MNAQDFNRLNGLLSKLDSATTRALETDGTFRKYHTSSISILRELPQHIRKLEQGLRTAKVVNQ